GNCLGTNASYCPYPMVTNLAAGSLTTSPRRATNQVRLGQLFERLIAKRSLTIMNASVIRRLAVIIFAAGALAAYCPAQTSPYANGKPLGPNPLGPYTP